MTTLKKALQMVDSATSARDLFNGDKDAAQKTYRDLAKTLHPDHVPDKDLVKANAAFAKLSTMWDAYVSGDADRTYASVTMATRKRAYVVGDLIAHGDIAGLYRGQYREDDETHAAVLKITRSAANNDLTENEATVLRHLADKADPAGIPYISQLLESFKYSDDVSNAQRQVNVLTSLNGFYTLAEVMKAYPSGLDIRDVAWMWKRLLIAIGHAHRAGVVHGAVIPEHVLIHPEMHGLCLVDWCYAVIEEPIMAPVAVPTLSWSSLAMVDEVDTGETKFQPLKAIVPSRRSLYPSEVIAKESVTAATDTYMAAKTIAMLFNTDVPKPFRAFIKGSTSARPQDAWELLKELDDLLFANVGPRKFRPFSMPND